MMHGHKGSKGFPRRDVKNEFIRGQGGFALFLLVTQLLLVALFPLVALFLLAAQFPLAALFLLVALFLLAQLLLVALASLPHLQLPLLSPPLPDLLPVECCPLEQEGSRPRHSLV
ncbi:hypothetical protein V8G54_007008 [Vigna mungo]|uniref:Uncharacterized protein n=1 Tax=Vigna mungo TaxID=3915 RepID=A0AAQ3P2M8_VIGMU